MKRPSYIRKDGKPVGKRLPKAQIVGEYDFTPKTLEELRKQIQESKYKTQKKWTDWDQYLIAKKREEELLDKYKNQQLLDSSSAIKVIDESIRRQGYKVLKPSDSDWRKIKTRYVEDYGVKGEGAPAGFLGEFDRRWDPSSYYTYNTNNRKWTKPSTEKIEVPNYSTLYNTLKEKFPKLSENDIKDIYEKEVKKIEEGKTDAYISEDYYLDQYGNRRSIAYSDKAGLQTFSENNPNISSYVEKRYKPKEGQKIQFFKPERLDYTDYDFFDAYPYYTHPEIENVYRGEMEDIRPIMPKRKESELVIRPPVAVTAQPLKDTTFHSYATDQLFPLQKGYWEYDIPIERTYSQELLEKKKRHPEMYLPPTRVMRDKDGRIVAERRRDPYTGQETNIRFGEPKEESYYWTQEYLKNLADKYPTKQLGGSLPEYQIRGALDFRKTSREKMMEEADKRKGFYNIPIQDNTYVKPSVKTIPIQKAQQKAQAKKELKEANKAKDEYLKQTMEMFPALKDKKQAEQFVLSQMEREAKGPDQLRETPKAQSKVGKFIDVAANPFLALDTYRSTGTLPDYFAEKDIPGTTGILDIPYMFTGAGLVATGAKAAKDIPSELAEGDYLGAGLDATMLIPGMRSARKMVKSPAGRLARKTIRPITKPVKTLAADIGRAADQLIVTPIQFRKDIKELKKLHKEYPKIFQRPEAQERLAAIGIDPATVENFMPNLVFTPNIGSSYINFGNDAFINVDFRQINKLKKLGYKTSPRNIYEHELGHHLQRETGRKKYLKNLEDYNQATQAYQQNLSNWEKMMEQLQKNPNVSKSRLEAFAKNKPIEPNIPNLNLETTNLDEQLFNLLPSGKKIDPKKLKLVEEGFYKTAAEEPLAEGSLSYFGKVGGLERMPHAREMRQNMLDAGVISDIYEPITSEKLLQFIKGNPTDRISSFISERPSNIDFLRDVMNKMPMVVPAAGAGYLYNTMDNKQVGGSISYKKKDGTVISMMKRGGWLDLEKNSSWSQNIPIEVLMNSYPELLNSFNGRQVDPGWGVNVRTPGTPGPIKWPTANVSTFKDDPWQIIKAQNRKTGYFKTGGWLDTYAPGGENPPSTLDIIKRRKQQEAIANEAARRKGMVALPDITRVNVPDEKVIETKAKPKATVKGTNIPIKQQAQLKPSYKTEQQRIEDEARGNYIENPTVMDYLGQAGYMPLLAMSDPFSMGDKLKQLRTIQSNPNLTHNEKFNLGMDIANEAVPEALLNVAVGEGLGGLSERLIQKAIPAPQMMSNLFSKLPKNYAAGVGPDWIPRNPASGAPLGTAEDLANRSAIQYAGNEPYLFNPENSTWEILKNEMNDKYRQGYTDIPQFNEELKRLKATAMFGKRPLLSRADFVVSREEQLADRLWIEDSKNWDIDLSSGKPKLIRRTGDGVKDIMEKAAEQGLAPDYILKRVLIRLANKKGLPLHEPMYFNPANPRASTRAVLYSNPNYSKMFGKQLNEIGTLGGKLPAEENLYLMNQIRRYEDMLKEFPDHPGLQDKLSKYYQMLIKNYSQKGARPYTGIEALQSIQPNKKGGELRRYQTDGEIDTPEEWEKEIRAVEHKIGHPNTWTLDSHKLLQDKLNEYKAWRENTPKGRAVIDYHNEPNEYVIPLPSHLKIVPKKKGGPIVTTEGFKMGPPPQGSYYRIPSDTLYNPTDYTIEAIANTGERKVLKPRTGNTKFDGASYVDEYQMKKGGQLRKYQTDGQVRIENYLMPPEDDKEAEVWFKKMGLWKEYFGKSEKPAQDLKPENKPLPKAKPLETNQTLNKTIRDNKYLPSVPTYGQSIAAKNVGSVVQPKTEVLLTKEDGKLWDANVETEVLNRQKYDNTRYGKFDKRGKGVMNRTDKKRNADSEKFFEDYAKPNSVIIDIGSALGNTDPSLAGVSVYEVASNPNIKKKNVKVIATDVPSEIATFMKNKQSGKAYPIDFAEVPLDFMTPVSKILKTKKLDNTKDVYLRAANSIDLLMSPEQTVEHFKHLANSLKDKNVTYLFNNVILKKPQGSSKFQKVGNLNNASFDHNNPSWRTKANRKAYELTGTPLKKGGVVKPKISYIRKDGKSVVK